MNLANRRRSIFLYYNIATQTDLPWRGESVRRATNLATTFVRFGALYSPHKQWRFPLIADPR